MLLKPNERSKKNLKQENHNLLNLSQYDDKPISPKKFTKLENIPSKAKATNERESSLPKMDESEEEKDIKSARVNSKSKNIFSKKEVPIEIIKSEKKPIRDVENKPEDIQAELDLLDKSDDDEDDLLNEFKKNVKDSSFILNDPKYSKSKYRATDNDDILKTIEGIDSKLDEFDVDDDDTGRDKNKSAFIDNKSNKLSVYQSKPSNNGGDKIMKVINNFGVDKYNEHVKKAENILMDNDSDDEKYKFKPKKIPSENNDSSTDVIKNDSSKNQIKYQNNDDKIMFLDANKSYLDDNSKSKSDFNNGAEEDDPFSKDRKYLQLDKNESNNILESVPSKSRIRNDKQKHKKVPSHQNYSKNQIDFLNDEKSNADIQNEIEEDPPSLKKPSDQEDLSHQKSERLDDLDDFSRKMSPKQSKIKFLQADSSAPFISNNISQHNENDSKSSHSSNNSSRKSRPSPQFLNFKASVNDPYNASYISKPVENDNKNLLDDSPASSHNSLFYQDKQKQNNRIQKFGKPYHNQNAKSEVYGNGIESNYSGQMSSQKENKGIRNNVNKHKSKQLFKLNKNSDFNNDK